MTLIPRKKEPSFPSYFIVRRSVSLSKHGIEWNFYYEHFEPFEFCLGLDFYSSPTKKSIPGCRVIVINKSTFIKQQFPLRTFCDATAMSLSQGAVAPWGTLGAFQGCHMVPRYVSVVRCASMIHNITPEISDRNP